MGRQNPTFAVFAAFGIFLLALLSAAIFHLPRLGFYGLLLFITILIFALGVELLGAVTASKRDSALSWYAGLAYGSGLILVLSASASKLLTRADTVRRLTAWGLALFVSGLAMQVFFSGMRGIRASVSQNEKSIAMLKGLITFGVCGTLSYYALKFVL